MLGSRKRTTLLAAVPLAFAAVALIDVNTSTATARRTAITLAMDGVSERPKTVKTEGKGTAKFSWTDAGPITYSITVKGISGNPTAAHIHGPSNSEGVAGPIVTFKLDSLIPNGTIASGTLAAETSMSVSLDSLKKLITKGMAYVNVHTVKNPGGEIRGQFK